MKVIFLDIDGVMNTEASVVAAHECGESSSGADGWDINAVTNLKHILEKTDAKIVISSTWRLCKQVPDPQYSDMSKSAWRPSGSPAGELERAFRMYGLKHWFDVTPRINEPMSRGREIKAWLANVNNVTHYVILDDDSDMLDEQMPFFVKTKFYGEGGLTSECADKAIRILNR